MKRSSLSSINRNFIVVFFIWNARTHQRICEKKSSAEYGIECPTGDLKNLSNLSISNLRTTSPNIATSSTTTTTNPSYTHKPTNDNNYCLYKYNEFNNECNNLMQQQQQQQQQNNNTNSKLNGKNISSSCSSNHVVQKNTFFKSFTRSSSFCRIKVNPKKFRNISFKFRKTDKVCCTPDYTATTAPATSSQVRGKFHPNHPIQPTPHKKKSPTRTRTKQKRTTTSPSQTHAQTFPTNREWIK